MTEWTAAVWGAIGSAFAVGLFVGVIFTRFTHRNIQKQLKLEADLKSMQAQANEQNQQLEKHFAHSATLLTTLAEDYKKLYDHLAQGSAQLLTKEQQEAYFKLNQNALTNETNDEHQPRDYSEGSSGLLKR